MALLAALSLAECLHQADIGLSRQFIGFGIRPDLGNYSTVLPSKTFACLKKLDMVAGLGVKTRQTQRDQAK